MVEKYLMKGNEAIGRAAIEAGCKFYAGYPITPQNEIPEYLSRELPRRGGAFVQAESEIAAINMVFGASAAGVRAMTSSSSPGIALKQEGISYLARGGLPAVIINVMRGGPGLGGIQPAQSDYRMAVKGGGNGDYHTIVLAPANVQEAVELVTEAFELSDFYRNPVMVLADGLIGQMMEPVEFSAPKERELKPKDWALTGSGGGKRHIIQNFNFSEYDLEKANLEMQEKYDEISANEQRWEELFMEDAEYAFVAYGTASRILKTTLAGLRADGHKIGMIRPVTLWPFPEKAFRGRPNIKKYLAAELSLGQMAEDVKLAADNKDKVRFYGRTGGVMFSPEEAREFALKEMGAE